MAFVLAAFLLVLLDYPYTLKCSHSYLTFSMSCLNRLSSDSALYQAKVINWCRRNKISFTVAADQDRGVKQAIGGNSREELETLKGQRGHSQRPGGSRDSALHERHGRSLILKLATTEEKFQIYLNMRHCCLEFT